jgi:hypothetical protein
MVTSRPVFAESDQNLAWCKGGDEVSPDQQIAGCTALIKSGSYQSHDLARAYFSRATGRLRKQDLEKAIGDLDAGLALDPNNAAALYNPLLLTKRRAISTERCKTMTRPSASSRIISRH